VVSEKVDGPRAPEERCGHLGGRGSFWKELEGVLRPFGAVLLTDFLYPILVYSLRSQIKFNRMY